MAGRSVMHAPIIRSSIVRPLVKSTGYVDFINLVGFLFLCFLEALTLLLLVKMENAGRSLAVSQNNNKITGERGWSRGSEFTIMTSTYR